MADQDLAEDEPAYFDDSRKALVFALNASRAEVPRPVMNRAMADAKPKPLSKAAQKRAKKAIRDAAASTWGGDAPLSTDEVLEAVQPGPGQRRSPPPGPRPLRNLDKAHHAGFILAQLARADYAHQVVLRGLCTSAYHPCSCRSPCCSGWRRNARWAEAVKETCLLLRDVGDITREPGKRGLSTNPAMRLALVEQFYTKNAMTVARAAEIGGVSTMTATKHRDWILAYLEQAETEAWLSVDAIFDQAGITGALG